MSSPFDHEIDRRRTHSVKWEFFVEHGEEPRLLQSDRAFGPDRILPMWVADMDFRTAEPIINAIVERAEHGIYGYSAPSESHFQAVIDWQWRRNGWQVQKEWLCHSPGVVPGLNMMIQAYTNPGDGVLIQPPVYHPFPMAIENNGRRIISNQLLEVDGYYQMDFQDLEEKIKEHDVKLAILCHPHNPIGRVWTREELGEFAEICISHNVIMISDEIHGDLIYSGIEFNPLASLDDAYLQSSVTCMAPSKTFNLAGLHTSILIIPDEKLRGKYMQRLQQNGLMGIGLFGLVALEAAYTQGESWLEQMMEYVEGNYAFLESFCEQFLPKVKPIKPQGTYLVWLDCRELGLPPSELGRLLLERAGVYLDDGVIFGEAGSGFERINIACPRSLLEEAMGRIRRAITQQSLL